MQRHGRNVRQSHVEVLDERAMLLWMDDNPPRADAGRPTIERQSEGDGVSDSLEIGSRSNDQRIATAEFHDRRGEGLSTLSQHAASGLGTAGEHHQVDALVYPLDRGLRRRRQQS